MALEDNKTYVPTLAVRASEMNGLEFLPSATKDRMTPCFLLAPWANSNTLEKSIERIEKAFPRRPYILDIDRDYLPTNLESDPQRELASLLDPDSSFSNWAKFIKNYENIWPCLQTEKQSKSEIMEQIKIYQDLGRNYCLRIIRNRPPTNLKDIIATLSAVGSSDFIIILEGGWTEDPLELAMWFNALIVEGLNDIDAAIPIVVSCTSMPKLFTVYDSDTPTLVGFKNRELLEQVARNRQKVIYGDWGSTRPRERGGFANRPLDRIDYPTERAWHIARKKGWTFQDAAKAILDSSEWSGSLKIWGEELIENTAISINLGINTPQKNVAARVNIHLHRQAFYKEPIEGIELDEYWED